MSATSDKDTAAAQSGIEALLRRRHNSRSGDDFSVRNLADIASAQQEGASTMTSLLAGIALVSLLVGGIGIMNIMLVSVTERTREISMRIAVGTQLQISSISFSTQIKHDRLARRIPWYRYRLRHLPDLADPILRQADATKTTHEASSVPWSRPSPVASSPGYAAYKASRLDPVDAALQWK